MTEDDYWAAFWTASESGEVDFAALRRQFAELGEDTLDELEQVAALDQQLRGCAETQTRPETLDPPSFDHYRIEAGHLLGRGGLASVHRAVYSRGAFGRVAAIKIPLRGLANNPDVCDYLRSEARITARLDHPNIVTVFDAGEHPDGYPYFSMRLVEGETLAARLSGRSSPRADLLRWVGVFRLVCGAVAYAHERRVVHLDLKPGNVMLGRFGDVQVMDWGFARELGVSPDAIPARVAGLLRASQMAGAGEHGTPGYMAPEQASREAVKLVSDRTDVFGLGGILCQILTGRPVYDVRSAPDLPRLQRACDTTAVVRRARDLGHPAELVGLLAACLARNPADRPTAADVEKRVSAYIAGVNDRLLRIERRKKWAIGAAVAAAVLPLAAWLFAAWQTSEQQKAQAAVAERGRNAGKIEREVERCEQAIRGGDAAVAAGSLGEVDRLWADGGGEPLTGRAARCRADLVLLRDLDQLDDFRWTPLDGERFPTPDEQAARWTQLFATHGLIGPGVRPAEAALQIGGSHLRDRLVGELDMWLVAAPSREARALLSAADPDPYRDVVRTCAAARMGIALMGLATHPAAAAQPPEFVAAQSTFRYSLAWRENMIGAAARRNPRHFPVLMAAAALYPINSPSTAAQRLRWYQAARAVRPDSTPVLLGLASAMKDAGDSAGAVAVGRELVRRAPTLAKAHYNLGVSLTAKGELAEAEAAYRRTLELDRDYVAARYNLGTVRLAAGDWEGAVASWRKVLESHPDHDLALYNLGVVLYERGQREDAVKFYQRAAKANPSSPKCRANLGNAMLDRRQWADAIRWLEEALALDPTYALAHHNLGVALQNTGQAKKAIAAYRTAIACDPKDYRPYTNLGNLLDAAHEFDAGLAAHRDAVRLNPAFAEARSNLAMALCRKGQLDEALTHALEAVRLGPTEPAFHLSLGNVWSDKKHPDRAAAAYENAVKFGPKLAGAHYNLGNARKAQGRPGDAAACYRRAAECDPRHPGARFNLANTLVQLGDLAGAEAAYAEYVKLRPEEPQGQKRLAAVRQLRAEHTAPPPRLVK